MNANDFLYQEKSTLLIVLYFFFYIYILLISADVGCLGWFCVLFYNGIEVVLCGYSGIHNLYPVPVFLWSNGHNFRDIFLKF